MNNLHPVFGLEIHLELKTNSKAFSNTALRENQEANHNITPYDLAYPGTKPIVNKKMVQYAYMLASVLRMRIESEIHFDRKNYFYPDLSKGFQITQFYLPIGNSGQFILINKNNEEKIINISEIHMEEDTAKQIQSETDIKYDFNRAGIPLIEIVTDHRDFKSIEEVIMFVEQFRELVKLLEISDAKLEEGSMRVDVNVSLKNPQEENYRERVEIKNLNSLNNIEKALKYEIFLQQKIYDQNEKVEQQTKRWDEEQEVTIATRNKGEANFYRYIPETNILPITLNQTWIKQWEAKLETLPLSFKLRSELQGQELTYDQVRNVFNAEKYNLELFLNMLDKAKIKDLYNFIFVRLQGIVNNYKTTLKGLKLKETTFLKIITLLNENKMTNDNLKHLIEKVVSEEIKQDEMTKELIKFEIREEIDDQTIINYFEQIWTEQQEKIASFNQNEKKISGLMVGQTMKLSKGQANPAKVSQLLTNFIKSKI